MDKNKTKIKICGIKNVKIIEKIIKLKIDFLGLNFIEESRRYIEKNSALEIVRTIKKNSKINIVGLFQDHTISYVNKSSQEYNLDYVQLCGNEDLKYIQELDIKVIKVIHIKSQDSVKEVKKKINDYLLICEYIILDTYSKKASGGTGKSFDWNEYSSLFSKKVFVAGGLNPDNVSEVVKTYAPWGIDVSSGVETNGEKDIYKIENFINRSN
ncbi:MAG: phosphoribosylanthranilate isomerase [Dehalococcoidia bacterium]|nr:N-(5'-phosphoribosyl)anthranilate isomerase [Chloroflexota bacterium]OUW96462.1 MAG: hypothetical protein CBD90_00880 [Chloroflexi bacterium TMED230]RZP13362.1 MAG: phosphoribosylanthranilate isomerase [Chloroflexota bacterium]|tara:strand:- start:9237 stop:9872 length:636 start_codon:yes stop_codon:yes gene_type:complete